MCRCARRHTSHQVRDGMQLLLLTEGLLDERTGARVLAKAYPEEKVGVFAQHGSRIQVVEYSELDPHEAAAVETGEPTEHACMHRLAHLELPSLTRVLFAASNLAERVEVVRELMDWSFFPDPAGMIFQMAPCDTHS